MGQMPKRYPEGAPPLPPGLFKNGYTMDTQFKPQTCKAINTLKRIDVARGSAVLSLTVEVEVPIAFYKQHRHDPALLVQVVGVSACKGRQP